MKTHTLTAIMLSLVFSANAQLEVTSNGQVIVGQGKVATATEFSSNDVSPSASYISSTDTTSTLKIMGRKLSGHSGEISFGNKKHVYIKELNSSFPHLNNNGILELGGLGGFAYKCGSTKILDYNPTSLIPGKGAPFSISATVYAPQYLTSSDATLKTKVEPLDNMGSLLAEITPVSYFLKSDSADDDKETKSSANNAGEARPQYGFIAQEVKEIIPDLVYQDSEGLLSIDYTGFIPLLVDAVKNMGAEISELKTQVSEQENIINSLKNPHQMPATGSESEIIVASLSQNKPNPFKVSTSIGCVIPESVSSSFLCVYDLNGGQKLRRDISQRGSVEVTIEGNTLTAGMYIYALVCDGIEIDSKRMILTD